MNYPITKTEYVKQITKHVTLLSMILIMGLAMITGCKGPAGSESPQGPQGSEGQQGPKGAQGPIGPAGADGSMIFSGQGMPGNDTGDLGDYYLNTNTGEMYGPKADGGWDNPIIVLKGEDGKDGKDGNNGQDGEDGSQTLSGNATPRSAQGSVGDFYLDKSSYELYGPKTKNGWGTPLNLKGADGNANVTRYLFNGTDFIAYNRGTYFINDVNKTEMQESAWLVYLIGTHTAGSTTKVYHSVPGLAHSNTYGVNHFYQSSSSSVFFEIDLVDGSESNFDRVKIVRIAATNTVKKPKRTPKSIIPKDLPISNYKAIAEHYGFGTTLVKHLSINSSVY